MRAALFTLCTLSLTGSALAAAAGARSLPQESCTYYYTARTPSPAGVTTGQGTYAEGEYDPEGRLCHKGRWLTPAELLADFTRS
ncbi:hypothetical protein Misp01_16990 [Microtetraspora sp. NBRC 13810]|uniref:hypothetical protein n=1 Tax=Microtetraspora sp. NBRC 13810 TaxID=3030990 RepID=UPI00249FE3BA|nr:hypothetical protein [Microtetraspora sp. NBRC 13810]GLW06569.1 hypothetical protein Misp01_16990 [Microtetraspora sp. NBRC 13810]